MRTDFETLLSRHRARSVPTLPGSFSGDVRRAIRLRASGDRLAWWEDALDVVRRPGVQFAALAAAVIIGLLAPGLRSEAGPLGAPMALGMDVFSSRAASFPSGLLAIRP